MKPVSEVGVNVPATWFQAQAVDFASTFAVPENIVFPVLRFNILIA